jgi:hypothetical protein
MAAARGAPVGDHRSVTMDATLDRKRGTTMEQWAVETSGDVLTLTAIRDGEPVPVLSRAADRLGFGLGGLRAPAVAEHDGRLHVVGYPAIGTHIAHYVSDSTDLEAWRRVDSGPLSSVQITADEPAAPTLASRDGELHVDYRRSPDDPGLRHAAFDGERWRV